VSEEDWRAIEETLSLACQVLEKERTVKVLRLFAHDE